MIILHIQIQVCMDAIHATQLTPVSMVVLALRAQIHSVALVQLDIMGQTVKRVTFDFDLNFLHSLKLQLIDSSL